MWKWLTKWKLVDTTKCVVFNNTTPYSTYAFSLSKKQQEAVDKLYEQYGGMDYCFYFTGSVNVGFKVKIWKTNEWIDLTNVSS